MKTSVKNFSWILFLVLIFSCKNKQKESQNPNPNLELKIAGAMRDVMWKGELEGKIALDSISDKEGLYGLGPLAFLKGEILINNGKSYFSKVTSDSTMEVMQSQEIAAPFFVYGNVINWDQVDLPSQVKSIQDLESFIDEKSLELKRPFAFKLTGKVSKAKIHIQNLPDGTKVSNPDEAHQGQINYPIREEEVEVVGFFSTEHQGVFTHHDSYLHMHLITKDESKMGHLDELEIGEMRLYLPQN
ncbi:acetolactate decarboxylase [Algoriphagus sp. PAP.12]|uniref:acetolactate decarboxylase n=1 Tax=Algoriphagus sp. PAP.12 TaxID=2996678 RepID=UPI00227AE98C|nr:acetolactate decarboxylase [Algoriphagus sp. PAP.12]